MTGTFLEPGKATVIVDGQYGSAGKGAVAGFIASRETPDIVVSNSGSQAGHTFVDNPYRYVTRHLPIAGVINPKALMYLSGSCIIDLDVLISEIREYGVSSNRIVVHPGAAVIGDHDIEYEKKLTDAIGSTGKGNGAALATKILRSAKVMKDYGEFEEFATGRVSLNHAMREGDSVLVEAAQGFSLSLDEKFYPHCTSRNCWAGQALADAWIHPDYAGQVVMVVRTFPIRVAGNSGDCYSDQEETTWEEIGVTPEITTVTKKVRRVFTFSMDQLREAAMANRPDWLAVSHLDYLHADDRYDFVSHCLRVVMGATGKPCRPIYGSGPDLKHWGFKL